MKVFIDNFINHIAFRRMLPYLEDMGVKIEKHHTKADIYIANVRMSGNYQIPMISRLDGVYYNTDINYIEKNLGMIATHKVANGIVYQSKHCENSGRMYILNHNKPYKIIFNGIEPNWCGSPEKHDGINITVTAKWRRHKRLKETIDVFLEFLKYKPNSYLHIFGMLHDNPVPNNPNIKYYGHVDHQDMVKIFKITDFSIHLSKRDACPNSVVEFIGAGIPVITTNLCGGSTEMCEMTEGCKVVYEGEYDISPVPHYRDQYNILPKSTSTLLVEEMVKISENPYKVNTPEELTARKSAQLYYNFMKEILSNVR